LKACIYLWIAQLGVVYPINFPLKPRGIFEELPIKATFLEILDEIKIHWRNVNIHKCEDIEPLKHDHYLPETCEMA